MKIIKVSSKPFSSKTNFILNKSKECLDNNSCDCNIIISCELNALEILIKLDEMNSNLKSYLIYNHNFEKSIVDKIKFIIEDKNLKGKINIYILGTNFFELEGNKLNSLKLLNINEIYYSKQSSIALSDFNDESISITEYII